MHVKINTRVEDIDSQKGLVRLSDQSNLPYDILVMATGAAAQRLNIPGVDMEGVFVLRNLTDALNIKSYLNEKTCRKAILIGAGYIGMEMCEAFAKPRDTNDRSRMFFPARLFAGMRICQTSLEELGKNNGQSNLVETVTVNNTSAAALDLHLFQYADFDVDGEFDGNIVNIVPGRPRRRG